MRLKLDANNRIVGVNTADSTYDYVGDQPVDLMDHATDGYYMIRYHTIMAAPTFNANKETVILPSQQTQINASLTKALAAATETATLAQKAVAALTKQVAELKGANE